MEVDPIVLRCLNGPCEDAMVDAPPTVTPGMATALRWANIAGKPRYAVYIAVNRRGAQGLLYLKSYEKPYQAQQLVEQIGTVFFGRMLPS